MRTRRFRPAFDQLGLRITPSDGLAPGVVIVPSVGSDTGDFIPTSNDPGFNGDSPDGMVYVSGVQSGYDPFCPDLTGSSASQ